MEKVAKNETNKNESKVAQSVFLNTCNLMGHITGELQYYKNNLFYVIN